MSQNQTRMRVLSHSCHKKCCFSISPNLPLPNLASCFGHSRAYTYAMARSLPPNTHGTSIHTCQNLSLNQEATRFSMNTRTFWTNPCLVRHFSAFLWPPGSIALNSCVLVRLLLWDGYSRVKCTIFISFPPNDSCFQLNLDNIAHAIMSNYCQETNFLNANVKNVYLKYDLALVNSMQMIKLIAWSPFSTKQHIECNKISNNR